MSNLGVSLFPLFAKVQSQVLPFTCARACSCTFPFNHVHILLIKKVKVQSLRLNINVYLCMLLFCPFPPSIFTPLQHFYSHVHINASIPCVCVCACYCDNSDWQVALQGIQSCWERKHRQKETARRTGGKTCTMIITLSFTSSTSPWQDKDKNHSCRSTGSIYWEVMVGKSKLSREGTRLQ